MRNADKLSGNEQAEQEPILKVHRREGNSVFFFFYFKLDLF